MSNDKYKSVEHRVVMNSHEEARVSSAIFYNPGKRGDSVFYGPLPELVTSENPPKYRNFTMPEFLGTFFKRELASNALIEHFKIWNYSNVAGKRFELLYVDANTDNVMQT